MNNSNTSQITSILVRIGLSLFFLLMFGLLNYFQDEINVFFIITKWLFLYLTVLVFLSIFEKKYFIRQIYSFFTVPFYFLLGIAPIIYSLGAIFFAFIFTLLVTTILLIQLPAMIFNYTVQAPAFIYILLSITSIIITTFGNNIIQKWHNFHYRNDKELHHNLSIKIFDQRKSRYMIFMIYFFLLIIFNLATFNNRPILRDENLATAILQSFATYIAFDRLITNWNSVKLK